MLEFLLVDERVFFLCFWARKWVLTVVCPHALNDSSGYPACRWEGLLRELHWVTPLSFWETSPVTWSRGHMLVF